MVRFSCFAHIHRHKPRKTLEDISQGQVRKNASNFKSLNSSVLSSSNAQVDKTGKPAGSAALERGWKSEEIKGKVSFEQDTETHQLRHLKKSQSLGDELFLDGRAVTENDTDDATDHIISPNSPNQNGSAALGSRKYVEGSSSGLYHKATHHVVPVHLSSNQVNNGSIFSVGDLHHLEKESKRCSVSSLSGDQANNSINHAFRTSPVIVKSNSMTNIADSVWAPGRSSPFNYLAFGSRSSDDLRVLDMHQKEKSVLDFHTEVRQEQEEQGDGIWKSENNDVENFVDNGYDGYGHSSLTKDWIVPVTDELNPRKFLHGESSLQPLDELTGKDFKNKRIQEWVNDLQHCSMFEEANVVAEYDDETQRESTALKNVAASKGDVKLTPGMEAAKKYISSLSSSAAAAQLVNHGLVVIPFLGVFVSLRVLNLSGNAIVRITAGALPRGLHILNLSKNSISTIEGLRELTRLRVLDMSYNRILRIGHGLASCSSLKELYLAGNKISEVEGLHRLLKLTVLDLRFNKISTAKCLSQLAANYNSLQAISLEGNPAQKNVGDEQLRKYLLGHLPHLVYFNRQAIKTSSLKDAAERSIRLGRSDHKGTRKSSHGTAAAAHKPLSSAANHSSRNQIAASHKRSKGRNGRLPPSRINGANQNQFVVDMGNRAFNIKSELSIRRSRSEGTLGAL